MLRLLKFSEICSGIGKISIFLCLNGKLVNVHDIEVVNKQ